MEWFAFIVVVLGLLGLVFNYRKRLTDFEKSYSDYFFSNPRPMWIFEPDTLQISEVNDAAIAYYGYTRKEFVTLNLRHLRPASEVKRLEETLRDASENLSTMGMWIHKKKNGDTLFVDVISRMILWKGKRMRIALMNDATELVTSKETLQAVNNKLQETLQRYDTLIEATHEAVWEYDLGNGTVLWNRGIETIFGYTDVPADADTWFSKINSEDLLAVQASMADAIENRQATWTSAYRFSCANGNFKHVENRGVIIYPAEGKSLKIIGSMRDVETRYQLEKEVLKLSMIAQLSSNAILVMDSEGYIEWANESFINLSGFTLEEAKGKRPQELLHSEETSQITGQEIQEHMQANKRFSREIINYRKDKSKYWVNVHFSPIMANGELQNTIAIQNDITELKEREEKITEQNLRLREVAFANSHIIRAPVANIIGLSNLLAISDTLGEEDKEMVTRLLEVSDKLDILVRNIANRSQAI